MTFSTKIISVTFTLANGQFQGTGSNTLTVSGRRVLFHMEQQGIFSKDYVVTSIYGMTQSQMNQLSTYAAYPYQGNENTISVSAGDASGMALVFQGNIFQANADYNAMPNVPFVLTAFQSSFDSVVVTPPTSYSGPTDVASILTAMGAQYSSGPLRVENNGVDVKLASPYFSGSLGDQVNACVKAANIDCRVSTVEGVIAIWPKGQSRQGQAVTISPTTGLIGYPTFNLNQIRFRCEFNPNIRFGVPVTIQSSLQPACGNWTPTTISYDLQSETPDGAWWQTIQAFTNFNGSPSGVLQ